MTKKWHLDTDQSHNNAQLPQNPENQLPVKPQGINTIKISLETSQK